MWPVLLVSATISIFSSALTLDKAVFNLRYVPNQLNQFEGNLSEYPQCEVYKNPEVNNLLLTYTFGIWLPSLLIAVTYILMYLRLKKQASRRQQSSTYNSNSQMLQISHTFSIVLFAFYICHLPYTITHAIHRCLEYFHKPLNDDVYQMVRPFAIFLFLSNSSLNPIIYSKIHVKIFSGFKRLAITCKEKCVCIRTLNKSKNPDATFALQNTQTEISTISNYVSNHVRVQIDA